MEGSSGMSAIIARNSELLDIVFSWSLTDIFDDNLYKEKVKKIPESFETVKEYFNSYVFPLLEETRADLCSSIKIMSGAPFSEVLSYVEVKPCRLLSTDLSRLYDINVGEWRNSKVRGKEPYSTIPGDVFALVKCRPESMQDLSAVAQSWVLAHAERISQEKTEEDDRADETLSNFRIRLSKEMDLVDDGYSSLSLVYLVNITTNKRIWNALRMHGNLGIIGRFLQRNAIDEDDHGPCCLTYDDYFSGSLCMQTSSRLNPSQNDAIVASLQAAQCKRRPHVQLVWGPPGTGKTRTLSILIYLLLKKNCRIVACAPTNTAITQVAGYVLELMNNASSEDSGWFLGDLLLFGGKQCKRVAGSDIEDIYLDHRVNILAECFKPMTGWRSCFPSLSYFLEHCVSEYNIFLENESRKREQSIDKVDNTSRTKSFVTFLRDRFKAAAAPVKRCVIIFCTHLSKRFIGEHNIDNMKSLLSLLDSFETLLLQDDVNSPELLEQFASSGDENTVNGSVLLEEKRRKCISALKTLHKSLGEIEPSSIRYAHSMTEEHLRKPMLALCFQMASLVFCTASSSDMLHRLPGNPFDVLVIDEAAQLKECESGIPLQLRGLRHAILFGDECQLPAMVNSNISSNAGFGRSLFQRLSLLGWPKHLLNVQYRMHPLISAFPNAKFYFKQILDAPNVRNKCYEKCYLPGPMYGPYSFINVSEGREEVDDDGCSKRNMVEVAVVVKILQSVYKAWRSSSQRLSIGVISPYAAQVVAIDEMLGRRCEELENFAVKVKSVDGFQGGEEDIVIISTVRSNLRGSVGFIADDQRTNVALTRARHCLWIIGHETALIRSDSTWKPLISDAKERNCFHNADEDESLAKAMIDIKKELDQLDDLLNRDSVLFKKARWKVLFSDDFVKTFSKLPTARAKKSVMNLLVKLSNGWRPKKIKADPVCESTLQIVKQYKVEGRFVICTNDIMKEGIYFQVLKIWDIVLLEDVAKLVRRLENIYKAFTDDFLSLCRERSLQGELEIPRTWNTSLDIVRFKRYNFSESATVSDDDSDGVNYVENAKVSESLLLMKFYALSAGTVSHLLSDVNGRALDLPFEVTDEEKRIIQHDRSSFILGRSGTGKTTVLTMKLFQKEQLHQMALEGLGEVDIDASITNVDDNRNDEHVLRQLFVTVSPKLCHAIKQHVSQLKSFAHSESSSMESVATVVECIDDRDQFRGIPDSFVGIPPKSYPLVITFSKFLLMLDGTLGASYFDRFRDEMRLTEGGNSSSRPAAFLMRSKEVNFDRFSACYWPHINVQLTKGLDASRVFTEIISSIKGGLQAGETDDGKLSMESYLQLSEGRASTLSWQQREMIYNIFLDYERMRVERGEFDLADLVNDLHRRLTHERYDGDSIDFVYIDEVQDLTIRQIALFKYICKNVDEGFVFSGDTAQTIARGIDFRFQDVRCLFFKEFVMRKRSDDGHEGEEKGQISPIFHLSQNFRTHAGILKLGDSVIQLIYHFFPQSVDILPPETSLIFGEAPILLESGSDENAIVTIFGNTGNVGGNLVGFGAEQVILVRDHSVQKEISSYVGKNALVLTIIECKGLEFQDVLLYNFFGSSPLGNKWRVIYEYMKVNDLLDSALPQSFPDFNHGKHNVLCSELKQLYVAITRTRQRLWICENKEDIAKPMFDYWKKKHVVQVRHLDDSLARAMQVASSPEEWRARGKKLLAVNNYEVATMCFERAGDKHWETFAKAAGMESSAARAQNHEEAFKILRQAGELFESINEHKRAADCYYESKNYDKAGRIYHQHCGELELERAGECFTLSGCYELAAEVYAKGNFFSECLSSCTKGNLFDMGLKYIQCWKHQATLSQCSVKRQRQLDTIEQSFLEKCALSYYERDDRGGMMKFVKAFCSEDAMRNFLRNWDCLDELLMLEQELGNFLRAADVARERGDVLLEASLLEKTGLYKEACDLFLCYTFASCLWAGGGNGWPLKQFPQKVDVLLKAKSCAYCVSPQQLYNTACTEILILLNRNHSLSVLKELLIMCQNQKCVRGEIIVTRRILDLTLETHVPKYEYESGFVDDLCTHSMQIISQNKVSVETMIYFWNSYKETIIAIFECLKAVEHDENSDLDEIGEFCFSYLGVRMQSLNMSRTYVCLCPEAKWLGNVRKKSQSSGKLFSIDKQHLLSAARDYWSAELFCTGMKVLHILEALLKHTNKAFGSPFSKTRIATHVYEVSQLLVSWKYMKHTHNDAKSLQKFIDLSLNEYFGNVFPLNWRKSVCKDMIVLRETDVSSKMLKEISARNLQGKGWLAYGRLGRLTMVLLGSSKGRTEICETALKRLDDDSPWRPFFMLLSGCRGSDCPSDGLRQLHTSLAFNIHTVVSELHSADWQRERDYIIPICFLYLVDRLMVSLVVFRGSFTTCRSSLVEWLIHHEWKPTFSIDLGSIKDGAAFESATFVFLCHIVHELIVKKRETIELFRKVGINVKDYPVLLLRLVILMCLLHLNYGCWHLLRDVLQKQYITAELPPVFCSELWGKNKWVVNLATVARALKAIEDPMVIVTSREGHSDLSCKDAIQLLMVNQDREDLLRSLFPADVKFCQGRAILHKHSQSSFTSQGSEPHERNEGCMEVKSGVAWELFDSLKLVENEDDQSRRRLVSCAPSIKAQVDGAYNIVTNAIAQTSAKHSSMDDESKYYAAKAECLLIELRLLSAALDASGEQLTNSISLIKDIFKRLESLKPVFEHFLGPLVPLKVMTPSVNEVKATKYTNLEEAQKDDPSVADPGNRSINQSSEKNLEDQDDLENGEGNNLDGSQRDNSSATIAVASAVRNQNEGQGSKKNNQKGNKKSKNKNKGKKKK